MEGHVWEADELWTYYVVDHTPWCGLTAAAQSHHCNGNILALLEHRNHQTMTKNRPLLSLLLRLWAGLSKRTALCAVCLRMHLYGHPRPPYAWFSLDKTLFHQAQLPWYCRKTWWKKFHQCGKGHHILYVIFNEGQKFSVTKFWPMRTGGKYFYICSMCLIHKQSSPSLYSSAP